MLRAFLKFGCQLPSNVPRYCYNFSRLLQYDRIIPVSTNSSLKFGTLSTIMKPELPSLSLHQNLPLHDPQARSVTKFSRNKGKRKSVKAVLKRFFRLHWGGWIRTIAGRHKRIWKKSLKARKRAKQHVFCTGQQSFLLDKMVTKYWRTPKYYVEDPYEPYHTRQEHPIAKRKPS